MPNSMPLILLPGVGADERFFDAQRAAFSTLIVPHWLPPQTSEPLSAYARRMANAVDPGGPCFVGGSSFGGMVALEMAPHLDARRCFLLGTIRSCTELPLRWRLLLSILGPVIPDRCGLFPQWVARALAATIGAGYRLFTAHFWSNSPAWTAALFSGP